MIGSTLNPNDDVYQVEYRDSDRLNPASIAIPTGTWVFSREPGGDDSMEAPVTADGSVLHCGQGNHNASAMIPATADWFSTVWKVWSWRTEPLMIAKTTIMMMSA